MSDVIFYQDEHVTVGLDDLGDTWQLEGVVIGNGHHSLVMQTPFGGGIAKDHMSIFEPTTADLEAWLKHSDNPVAKLYHDQDNPVVKAVVRKSTRQLDQSVVWTVYHRDHYTCVYCNTTGVPLTYDHFLAQAYGGQTTVENGRTSCRPCNKKKGHMTIAQWVAYAAEKGLHDGAIIAA